MQSECYYRGYFSVCDAHLIMQQKHLFIMFNKYKYWNGFECALLSCNAKSGKNGKFECNNDNNNYF